MLPACCWRRLIVRFSCSSRSFSRWRSSRRCWISASASSRRVGRYVPAAWAMSFEARPDDEVEDGHRRDHAGGEDHVVDAEEDGDRAEDDDDHDQHPLVHSRHREAPRVQAHTAPGHPSRTLVTSPQQATVRLNGDVPSSSRCRAQVERPTRRAPCRRSARSTTSALVPDGGGGTVCLARRLARAAGAAGLLRGFSCRTCLV